MFVCTQQEKSPCKFAWPNEGANPCTMSYIAKDYGFALQAFSIGEHDERASSTGEGTSKADTTMVINTLDQPKSTSLPVISSLKRKCLLRSNTHGWAEWVHLVVLVLEEAKEKDHRIGGHNVQLIQFSGGILCTLHLVEPQGKPFQRW